MDAIVLSVSDYNIKNEIVNKKMLIDNKNSKVSADKILMNLRSVDATGKVRKTGPIASKARKSSGRLRIVRLTRIGVVSIIKSSCMHFNA